MKTVLLIRHAKSSWEHNVSDFDRPLNPRGKKDAPDMAKRLLKRQVKIDAFVSSPAKRAVTTATIFAEAYGQQAKNMVTIPSLYDPSVEAFYTTIEKLDDGIQTVAIFSHNPAITAFANQLTNVRIDDMPTCAIFGLEAKITNWKDFTGSEKRFLFFDYPKAQ